MIRTRYAYRLKSADRRMSDGIVTSDYAAKAPATAALYEHIGYTLMKKDRDAYFGMPKAERKRDIKEIAARDYELVTFVLVEEPELESLEEDSAWLGHLNDAGVDNWDGISFAYELKREA